MNPKKIQIDDGVQHVRGVIDGVEMIGHPDVLAELNAQLGHGAVISAREFHRRQNTEP